MTQPAPVGRPDWNIAYASARSLLVNVQNRTINSIDQWGPLVVGNMHSIGIRFFPSATSPCRIVVQWFIDQALTIQLTSDTIDCLLGQEFDQTITVKAPFANILVEPPVGLTTTYTLLVYEATDESLSQRIITANILLSFSTFTVGATSTATVRPTRVWAGPASLFAHSVDATSWDTFLIAETSTGVLTTMHHMTQVQTSAPHITYLPTCPVRVDMTNNDAVTRHFDVYLIAKPLYP